MSDVKSVRPPKPVEVIFYDANGEPFTKTLVYDLNAFAELEELFGSVDEAMTAMEKGSIKAVRALLWAGLIHAHLDDNDQPTLKIKEVGKWIQIPMLEGLSKKIEKALKGALPEAEVTPLAMPKAVPGKTSQRKTKTRKTMVGIGLLYFMPEPFYWADQRKSFGK